MTVCWSVMLCHWNIGAILQLLVLLLLQCIQVSAQRRNVTYQQDGANSTFLHLVFFNDSGVKRLYIGAKNEIIELRLLQNETFMEYNVVTTGPKKDSVECSPRDSCDRAVLTDNYNKILLLNQKDNSLITCGTLFQGSCEQRNVSNISIQLNCLEDVTPNERNESTLAFLIPRNVSYIGGRKKMIVGVTNPSLKFAGALTVFSLAGEGFEGKRMLRTERNFKMVFRWGFELGEYVYIITNQPDHYGGTTFVTKIQRMCVKETSLNANFKTIMDIQIRCSTSGSGHQGDLPLLISATLVNNGTEKVLVAFFTDAADPANLTVFNKSGVCYFTMKSVDEKFQENINDCLKTGREFDTRRSYWRSPLSNCPNASRLAGNSSCALASLFRPFDLSGLIGIQHLTGRSVLIVPNEIQGYVTAMQSATLNDGSTVLFLGTSRGSIFKAHLDMDRGNIAVYSNTTVEDNSPIKEDLLLDDDVSPEKLYAMTSKVVTQLPVQDCKSHPTCAVCLRSRDPYCGWCVEKGRCVVKEDCSLPGEAHWLHAIGNKQCMKVEMVDPEYVAVNNLSGTNISLKLNFLSPSSSYFCKFSSDRNQQYAPGKVTENRTLQCPTPSEVTFKGSQKSVMVEIWTKSSGFVPLVNTSINIVNCAVSHTCSSCVDLQACFWCIYENKCTNNDSLCPSPSDSASPPYVSVKKANCPEATFDIITVPNGAERQMKATGTNLPAPQNGFYYTCTVPSINLTVGATHDNETSVTCSSAPLKSTDPSPELDVKVQLLWQSSGTPPTEFAMKEVTMYRCDILGTDCSTCGSYNKPMNKQKDYGCTWCGSQGCGHKEIQTTCSKTACPAPTIIKVNPLFAHSFGGTMVTIKGKELGRWIKDVRNVTLAGQPCELVPEGFQVSKQITCRTKNGSKGYAPILVTVQNKTSPSRENFTFSNPQVNSVFPVKGPKAGGTRLTITGRNLWIGNQRSAYLGSGNGSIILRQCSMVNKMSLVCLTPAVEDPGNFSTLTVSIDGHGFTARSYVFEYTENPKVVQLEPLKSIRSGGRTITVTGVTLDSILSPAWFVRKENLCSEMQLCSHSKESNSTIMYCPSPSLAVPNWKNCSSRGVIGGDTSVRRRRATSDNTTKLRLGFLMDGVSNDDLDTPSLIYVNDPTYNKLKEKSYFKPNTLLYLSGNNLDDAATVDDVKVWICNSTCMVTNLNKTDLRCSQPKKAVGCEEKSGQAVYTVKVEVGRANYFVGKLIEEVFPLEYIIIVCVIIIALVGAFLFVTIKFIRQKRKHQQDIEQKQQEYLMLETKVRTGAREEFAGLQQDIRLVTSDVVRTGVPYKPLAHYTFSMLFPADIMAENTLLNHSQSNGDCGNRHERAIGLESLIGNKFFLLTTLRCLEAQKKLSSKDKSSLANVLTVILLDRLEYLMEIWKELMQEFVARSIDKKQQKQIMRRNDSIVEKLLSNWIALCMYDNMKNHTGASLFMLYISTEMLTNYGPADAVTGDTYYTLCEEKILKKNLDVEYLNIRVLVNGEEFTCKVLECDTVTQTKQKFLHQIYKSVPTPSRPRADQVDLEWHWGSNGRLILDDFDNTTEADGDWNRLNTLRHYNVKDYSVMALLSKEEGMESDNPYGNCISSRNNLLAIEGINVNMHSRIWHLVKPEDEYEENKQREIFEIYLPRLMSTKVHLIQYMDAFVDSVFDPSFVPVSVKYLFDFFDELAQRHGIQDSDVVHTWKSNSLPIRYWGSLLKAPHHVFDVQPPDLSEPSLEVLAQCFIDGCYNTELRLGKDSPASKLLFSRDLPRYREAVAKFYSGVKASSTVTREEVVDEVQQLSAKLRQDNLFSKKAALRELSETIKDYHEEVISALEENQESKTLQLGHKLEDYLESLAS